MDPVLSLLLSVVISLLRIVVEIPPTSEFLKAKVPLSFVLNWENRELVAVARIRSSVVVISILSAAFSLAAWRRMSSPEIK